MEVFYGIVLVAGGITKVLSDDKKFEKAFVDLLRTICISLVCIVTPDNSQEMTSEVR